MAELEARLAETGGGPADADDPRAESAGTFRSGWNATLLDLVQRMAHLGVWHGDVDPGHAIWFDELCRILGLPPGTEPDREVFCGRVHPDDRARLQAHDLEPTDPNTPGTLGYRVVRPDGEVRWIEAMTRPLEEAGRLVGFLGTVMDVSDQHEREARLQHSRKLEAVGRLATGLAHDHDNLLTTILGHARMLQDRVQAGELDEIVAASLSAAAITRKLLAYGRRSVLQPDRRDLNDIVCETLRLAGRLLGDDVQPSAKLEPALWPVVVDPGQIQQVLLNLAVNARDAMPRGGALIFRTANVPASPVGAEGGGDETSG